MDYLSDRSLVYVSHDALVRSPIMCGVSQSSVLEPIL